MTTTTDAERFPPPTPEQLAAREAARVELAAMLAAAPKTLRAVTTEVIYDVHPPVALPGDSRRRLIVAIEVRVTRTPGEALGRVRVRAEHRARNADGRPRANGEEWRVVPASLAGDLIVDALRS